MLYNCDEKHQKVVEFVLKALSVEDEWIGNDRAMIFSFLQEDGTCVMNYENASIQDLVVMQGNIGLAITKRYMELNWPVVINDETRSNEDSEDDE